MAAEAAECIRSPGEALLYAAKLRREADRCAIGFARTPAVLGTEQVSEELVAHDEQCVDPERAMVEIDFGERCVLDELSGIACVEHAIEVLATPQIDRVFELFGEDTVVRDRELFHCEPAPLDTRRFLGGRRHARKA
jgi:hypothetical protein